MDKPAYCYTLPIWLSKIQMFLGIQPVLGIGRLSMSRLGAEYRRAQATAGSLHAVCLRSAEDCFGTDTLPSFSPIGSNRDLAHTTFGEYSPRLSNPMFIGDQQHISTKKPDVADLREEDNEESISG
ncbi:hypothetical protein PanWU01x14_039670 [Parasponia andersonii]|uniref:Uncharacterized protein n=1 Tax=Parasponia andersonii TaxID=3476 RepID=A0A2P5DQZ6_PARAD|nr:hypothetical protein PanWU01x14_039670 [Parasponia andersonii]